VNATEFLIFNLLYPSSICDHCIYLKKKHNYEKWIFKRAMITVLFIWSFQLKKEQYEILKSLKFPKLFNLHLKNFLINNIVEHWWKWFNIGNDGNDEISSTSSIIYRQSKKYWIYWRRLIIIKWHMKLISLSKNFCFKSWLLKFMFHSCSVFMFIIARILKEKWSCYIV